MVTTEDNAVSAGSLHFLYYSGIIHSTGGYAFEKNRLNSFFLDVLHSVLSKALTVVTFIMDDSRLF